MQPPAGRCSRRRGARRSPTRASISAARSGARPRDPDQIKQDFARWPDANIGVPTGIENAFWVIEADTPEGHSVDGIANLRALEAQHGKLPDTFTVESPSGSLHYYYKWPRDCTIRNSASAVAPGVDVRGEGGMVIAAPSVKSGTKNGCYSVISNVELVDAPAWLIALALAATGGSDVSRASGAEPEADAGLIAFALGAIPNADVDWESWNRIGMACWRATGGSAEGFQAFDMWSQKSGKYNAAATASKWSSYFRSPPTRSALAPSFILPMKPTRIGPRVTPDGGGRDQGHRPRSGVHCANAGRAESKSERADGRR